MKKIGSYLIVLTIFGMFLMTTAYALDLETHDFDGHFKMDVPKGSSIKQINDTYEGGVIYEDSANKINITYTDTTDYSGSTGSMTAEAGTKMYSHDDYSIMEKPDGTNLVTYINKDSGKLVMISSEMPVEDMESMLDTVEF